MTTVSVTPASNINGAINDYTVSFIPITPVIVGDLFKITFPSEMTIPTTNPVCSTITCTFSGRVLTATMAQTVSNPTSFTFIVKSMVNPPDRRPTSQFSSIFLTSSIGTAYSQYVPPIATDLII
jgi:hypothetical protein